MALAPPAPGAATAVRRVRWAWVAVLVTISLWGASFVAARVALEAFTPLGLAAGRQLLGGALLLGVLRLRGGPLLPSRESRARVALLALILAAHMTLQAVGLMGTTAVNAGWIIAAIPVAIALGARWVLGQRLLQRAWWGAVLAFSGVLAVVGFSPDRLAQAHWGDALQAASCLTWATYTLAGTAVLRRDGALRVSAAAMLGSALPCLLGAASTGSLHASLTPRTVVAFLFLALLCSALAFVLWYSAVDLLGAVRAGTAVYLQPFVTLGVSSWILGEPWGGGTLAGGALVLAGVFLVQRGTPRAVVTAAPVQESRA